MQVSDVKFRDTEGASFSCATAWLGGRGEPGNVTAFFGERGTVAEGRSDGWMVQEGVARTSTLKVRADCSGSIVLGWSLFDLVCT